MKSEDIFESDKLESHDVLKHGEKRRDKERERERENIHPQQRD